MPLDTSQDVRAKPIDDDGAVLELPTLAGQIALSAAIGSPDDAAWDGVAAEASVISILKKIALDGAP